MISTQVQGCQFYPWSTLRPILWTKCLNGAYHYLSNIFSKCSLRLRYQGLPKAIKYNQEDYSDIPDEELAHVTRGRALEIYTWLFRPFLYYAIHRPANDPHRAAVQGFVDSAIKIARGTIGEGILHHRHHGTWFHLRNGTSAALSILAAHKCGHIELPPDWREVVRTQISVLEFWEKESPDITKAKDVLTTLILEC